jgi:hypothetical protein
VRRWQRVQQQAGDQHRLALEGQREGRRTRTAASRSAIAALLAFSRPGD